MSTQATRTLTVTFRIAYQSGPMGGSTRYTTRTETIFLEPSGSGGSVTTFDKTYDLNVRLVLLS